MGQRRFAHIQANASGTFNIETFAPDSDSVLEVGLSCEQVVDRLMSWPQGIEISWFDENGDCVGRLEAILAEMLRRQKHGGRQR